MKQRGSQYWYGIGMMMLFLLFFGGIAYIVYDLILQASTGKFSDLTLVTQVTTIFLTVIIGNYIAKKYEGKNNLKLDLQKSKKEIAFNIINLAGDILIDKSTDKALEAQMALNIEIQKARLLFNEKTINLLNEFYNDPNNNNLEKVVVEMKKSELKIK